MPRWKKNLKQPNYTVKSNEEQTKPKVGRWKEIAKIRVKNIW